MALVTAIVLGFNARLGIARSLSAAAIGPPSATSQAARVRVKPIEPPPLQRPAVKPDRKRLPNGATGALPELDGDPFHVNLPGGESALTTELARRAVDQVVATWGWTGDLQLGRRERSPRTPGGSGAQEVVSFEQRFQKVRVEYAEVRAVFQSGRGLVAVTGRVFSKVAPANHVTVTEAQAVEAAGSHVGRYTKVTGAGAARPELVVLPYADTMRFAWRVEVAAEEGAYRMWIDAATTNILRLEPLFSSASGGLSAERATVATSVLVQGGGRHENPRDRSSPSSSAVASRVCRCGPGGRV